jgi:hypothetical protein
MAQGSGKHEVLRADQWKGTQGSKQSVSKEVSQLQDVKYLWVSLLHTLALPFRLSHQ